MLFWTIQSIIISIVLIFLLHYLYTFFKDTLTVPIVKDLVNKPNEKYNEILSTFDNAKQKCEDNIQRGDKNNTSANAKNDMKNNLFNFLNDLKKNDPETNVMF